MHAPRRIPKRLAAAVVALAVAAPAAAWAATGTSTPHVVHTQNSVTVSGYDGGVALTPSR